MVKTKFQEKEYFNTMNYKFYINYCRLSGSDPKGIVSDLGRLIHKTDDGWYGNMNDYTLEEGWVNFAGVKYNQIFHPTWWLRRRMDKEYMKKAIKIGSTSGAPTIPILNRHSKLIQRITEDLK